MLNLLERFDLIGEGRTPLNVHRVVEAMKCKYMCTPSGSLLKDLPLLVGFAARYAETKAHFPRPKLIVFQD